jgi:hypothetical protein
LGVLWDIAYRDKKVVIFDLYCVKGENSWEKYEELEKRVDHRKNYEEYLKDGELREKKELLNKEEEYLKEQVYSYGIRNTHLKKQNAHI